MIHSEKIAYGLGYRTLPDGTVLGLRGKPIALQLDHCNRRYFRPRYNGGHITVPVHRLVAFEKFGQDLYTVGLEVRHKDNNSENNSWSNLLLGTKSQNMMDKPPEERKRIALLGAMAQRKLSEEGAQHLRDDHDAGLSYRKLVKKYGIAKSTVSYIVNRHTYS